MTGQNVDDDAQQLGSEARVSGRHPEHEVQVVEILRVLWKWKFVILGGAIVFGIAALILALRSPSTYEASIVLFVDAPRAGEQAGLPSTVPTFLALIRSRRLAAAVIDEFDLETGLEPFIRGQLEVSPISGTDMIRVTVRFRDPDLAATVANRLGELAVELNEDINQQDAVRTRDFIEVQVERARSRVGELQDAIVAYQNEAQIEILERRINDLILRSRTWVVDIAADSTEAEQTPAVQLEASTMGPDLAGLEVGAASSPTLVAHQSWLPEIDDGLQARIALIPDNEEERLEELDELYDVLHDRRARLENLQSEYQLAQQIHEGLSNDYQQARIRVASRNAQLRIVDPAIVPEAPLSRRTRTQIQLGFLLGLVVFSAAALFAEYLRRSW